MVGDQGIRLLQLTTTGGTERHAVIVVAGGGVGHREGSQDVFCSTEFTLGARARLQDGIDGHVLIPFIGGKRSAGAHRANKGAEYSTNPCALSGYPLRPGLLVRTHERGVMGAF
ncbi:hypothetical protein D3C79_580610 [compost metagenome]